MDMEVDEAKVDEALQKQVVGDISSLIGVLFGFGESCAVRLCTDLLSAVLLEGFMLLSCSVLILTAQGCADDDVLSNTWLQSPISIGAELF